MPWCPKCKNEYQDGISLCADCGCELVETLAREAPVIFGEKEQMQALREFLEFNRLEDVQLKYDEEEQVYELLVKEADQQKAARLSQVFLQQEAVRAGKAEAEPEKEAGEAVSEPAASEPVKRPAYLYRDSAEKAEDNRSSAWALLVVGSAGLLVMILGMTGILPFRLTGNSKYMVYGIMTALFLLFIVMGSVSMKNSRLFARKAESENSLRETLKRWCAENLISEEIDAGLGLEADTEEAALYFKRSAAMKERLNRQFVNLDEAFLESFIDDIYDSVFLKG